MFVLRSKSLFKFVLQPVSSALFVMMTSSAAGSTHQSIYQSIYQSSHQPIQIALHNYDAEVFMESLESAGFYVRSDNNGGFSVLGESLTCWRDLKIDRSQTECEGIDSGYGLLVVNNSHATDVMFNILAKFGAICELDRTDRQTVCATALACYRTVFDNKSDCSFAINAHQRE